MKLGDKLVGLDAFFWDSVEIPARKLLLVKPASVLEGHPAPASIILEKAKTYREQIEDLIRLKERIEGEKYSGIKRFYRWKVSRFIGIPVPSRASGLREFREMISAKYILDHLDLGDPKYHGTAWLILKLEGDTVFHAREEMPEKIYQWLLAQDKLFKEKMESILRRTSPGTLP